MFGKLTKYILSALSLLGMVACGDEVEMPKADILPDSPGTITISLKNSTATRAEEDDPFHETVIKDLYIGLYHTLAEETTPATWWRKVESVTANGQTKLVWRMTDDVIQLLFNGGNQDSSCRVVVVANVENVPDNASINQIRNMAVSSEFDSNTVPESFVMEGEAKMDYSVLLNKASATVSLIRAAAKINFSISLPEKVEIDGKDETWMPVPEGIKVLLNNGVKSAIAAPVAIKNEPWKPSDADAYFSSDPNVESSYRTMLEDTEANGVASGYRKYNTEMPYYTYPNTWIENHDGSKKTSITLMVPWKQEGADGEPDVYYYQVAVTPAGVNYVSRNNCYNVDLKVGMLGSVMPEKPLEVEGSYQIVNWQEEEIGIPIQDSRYLVVSPNVLTVNNEEEITIPFYTSHPAEISDISITYKRFNFYNDGDGDVVDIVIPKAVIDRSVMVTNTTRAEERDSLCAYSVEYSQASRHLTVKIKHPFKIWIPYQSNGTTEVKLTGVAPGSNKNTTLANVNNSIYLYKKLSNPEASYSPYEISVTLSHKDLPSVKEEIKITQYPGMYIEAIRNPGGYYNDDYKEENGIYVPINTNNHGYAFVNATYIWVDKGPDGTPLENPFGYWANNGIRGTGEGSTHSSLGSLRGIMGTESQRNPNNYIIHISQLEKGSKYVIGDPRSLTINNDLTGDGSLGIVGNSADAGSWCYSANALYEGVNGDGEAVKRKLRYYYPTIEQDATINMVAPIIRIASSFGKLGTYGVTRTNGRRRAATYQERGCAAGRWRVPTKGELEFILHLSGAGKIPTLFTVNSAYLTSQGPFAVDDKGNVRPSSNAIVIRAVYDEWYWNDKTDYVLRPDESGAYSYTLGDMPRAPREVSPGSN